MGKNSWTKSEVYGGVITSRTCPKWNGDEKTNLRLNDTDVIYEETATQTNQRPAPHLCDKVSDEWNICVQLLKTFTDVADHWKDITATQ